MLPQSTVRLLLVALLCCTERLTCSAQAALSHCAGEFSLCADGSCALVKSSCGRCKPTQYACPLDKTCLHRVEDYATICQGLAGTHLDSNLSPEARLDKLVDAVAQNLTELTRQLVNNAPAIDRLSLPAYNYLNDDEHGVIGTASATVFPMGVGMGASWSSETVHLVGAAIGVEARSTHNVLTDKSGNSCGSTSTGQTTANGCGITLYAPNINLVRDPRWGRAEEVFGEDPHLTSELAVSIVTGMQGNREGETTAADGGASLMAGACCKHYAVYSSEDVPTNRNQLNVNVSARSLHETYLPAMKACVQRAKATHVMCSYNSVNGKPTCAHDELLNGVLREQWSFDGFVVSDYGKPFRSLLPGIAFVAEWVCGAECRRVDQPEDDAPLRVDVRGSCCLGYQRRHGPGGRLRHVFCGRCDASGARRWHRHRRHCKRVLPSAHAHSAEAWNVRSACKRGPKQRELYTRNPVRVERPHRVGAARSAGVHRATQKQERRAAAQRGGLPG